MKRKSTTDGATPTDTEPTTRVATVIPFRMRVGAQEEVGAATERAGAGKLVQLQEGAERHKIIQAILVGFTQALKPTTVDGPNKKLIAVKAALFNLQEIGCTEETLLKYADQLFTGLDMKQVRSSRQENAQGEVEAITLIIPVEEVGKLDSYIKNRGIRRVIDVTRNLTDQPAPAR